MLKITHSLLSSFDYATQEGAREGAFEDFLAILRREPKEPTKAMLKGREFEDRIHTLAVKNEYPDIADGAEKSAINEFAGVCFGGSPQVYLSSEITVDCEDYQLVGVLDWLKAGHIYDIKRPGQYEYGKYQHSTQHPAYFALLPEAIDFTYLIFDGYRTYREAYYPQDTPPIDGSIREFIQFLKSVNLYEVYKEHWTV